MDYLSADRVELRYTLPLAEIIFDFFDQLKSRTKGYASLDYEPSGEQESDLVKVDILLHGGSCRRVQRHRPQGQGVQLRRHDRVQAACAHSAPAVRGADPGGDRQPDHRPRDHPRDPQGRPREVLRRRHHPKRKLLEKQKEGKKRMKMVGRVEVPQEAFIAALSTAEGPADKSAGASECTVSGAAAPCRLRRPWPAPCCGTGCS
jgi:GTP-binding protein LepA